MKSVLIIAGPSAVGKTAVASAVVRTDPRFTFLRSVTTRPRRGDGNDGEYIYLSTEEFMRAVEDGELCEYMTYGGYMYGTLRSELDRACDGGLIPLLVLDLSGVESMCDCVEYDCCAVYIYADEATVDSRLRKRYLDGTPTASDVQNYESRIARNRRDHAALPGYIRHFFTLIPNDSTVEDCRDRVLDAFARFQDYELADVEENMRLAEELKNKAEKSR